MDATASEMRVTRATDPCVCVVISANFLICPLKIGFLYCLEFSLYSILTINHLCKLYLHHLLVSTKEKNHQYTKCLFFFKEM